MSNSFLHTIRLQDGGLYNLDQQFTHSSVTVQSLLERIPDPRKRSG
jgi:hypothetical protein